MKRISRFILVTILVVGFLMIGLPANVHATHGFSSEMFTILVDGQHYEVWGYGGDGPVPALRLQDLAYILRDTPARFDIRESDDPDLDYWIIRGEGYTPIGTELAAIPEQRWGAFGSYGFFDWHGFDDYPVQTIIIGINGDYTPYTATALRLIQDVDYTYFPIEFFSALLGFSWDWVGSGDYDYAITTGVNPTATLHAQSPQLARLMSRLSGQWVDEMYYYSTVIDEKVVWPVELEVSVHGITDIVQNTVAPAGSQFPTWPQWWYPVSMTTLENGLVELIVPSGSSPNVSWPNREVLSTDTEEPLHDHRRFDNRRIVVDTSLEYIDEIIFFIDDVAHNMTRFEWDRSAMRYTTEAADNGGITLRYILDHWSFLYDVDLRVYRSAVESELGELLYSRFITDHQDSLLWQFTDNTIEHEQVYFYSLVEKRPQSSFYTSLMGGQQMRVDVDLVLGEPDPADEPSPMPEPTHEPTPSPLPEPTTNPSPTPEPLLYEPSTINQWPVVIVVAASALGIGIIVGYIIVRMFQKKRRVR